MIETHESCPVEYLRLVAADPPYDIEIHFLSGIRNRGQMLRDKKEIKRRGVTWKLDHFRDTTAYYVRAEDE